MAPEMDPLNSELSKLRTCKACIPNQQEVATEDVVTLHPSTTLKPKDGKSLKESHKFEATTPLSRLVRSLLLGRHLSPFL